MHKNIIIVKTADGKQALLLESFINELEETAAFARANDAAGGVGFSSQEFAVNRLLEMINYKRNYCDENGNPL